MIVYVTNKSTYLPTYLPTGGSCVITTAVVKICHRHSPTVHLKTCIKKNAVHTRFILITTLKRIHCCKSRFSLKDKGPLNNIPSSTFSPKKQQRCNLDRYSFVYVSSLEGELLFVSVMEQITLKNSVLVVKKQHDFVAGNVPNRMRSSKKKKSKIHGRLFI